jgi:sucrose phosphorylase
LKFTNKIMLITYPDSLGRNLKDLDTVLEKHFSGAIGGVHILPFFPSSADRGFAPTRYDRVDEQFGDFEDIQAIAKNHDVMFDFMVNHISRSSEYFKDFEKNKEQSPYKNFFIRYKDFWRNGEPTQEQVDLIYKRKPRAPYIDVIFQDGTTEKIWCSFSEEQIDLNVQSKETKEFIKNTLIDMCKQGATMIRLDAFAYAIKKPDTNCFFIEPDVWNLLYEIQDIVKEYNVEILPEIHEHYSIQMEIAKKGFWVYDFALPMLLLYSLFTGKGEKLKNWLDICPRKQFTTLDTHDGIGVVDVIDLLSTKEIEQTKELLFSKGANVKRKYNSADYNNLDIYQLNCTYYSALGNDDQAYLLARAIQFFAPGVPQVYYVGLLVGENDIELMESSKQGRDINRHYYTLKEIDTEMQRPVVGKLVALMRFRNEYPAFAGECTTELIGENIIEITRFQGDCTAVLTADLRTHKFSITCIDSANKCAYPVQI